METVFFSIFASNFIIFFVKYAVQREFSKLKEYTASAIFGGIFSAGLIVSGMCQRVKILGFLTLNRYWDISLLFVMAGAVFVNLFTFYYIIKIKKKPILLDSLQVPSNTTIDPLLIIGSLLFGIGWGIGGLCPGPALVDLCVYIPHMAIFMLFLALGQFSAVFVEKTIKKMIGSKIYGMLSESI